MGKKMKSQLKVVSGALMLALAGHAMAATDWLTPTVAQKTNPGTITVGTATATPTAWAGGNGETLVQQLGTSSTATTHFADYTGGGLGINNSLDGEAYGAQPDHAIDNFGRQEMVLLTFDKAVNLTALTMGYVSGDADFTVMAFNVNGVTGAPTLGTGTNKTWNSLGVSGSGWTLIGDYQNSTTGTKTFANSYYSSYWLIGAYNPLVGIMAGFASDNTADYFKLSSVSGNVCTATSGNCGSKVPEPSSLALLGLGIMGVLRMRKARKV